MNLDITGLLGFLGGACTTFAFIPQVVQVVRRRSAQDLSLSFALVFMGGIILWLLYGIMQGLLPVILWNGVTLFLAGALLLLKLRYSKS